MINAMVQHSMKPYRNRVECFIFQDGKLMVGQPHNWNGYVIPGGGVDAGESIIKAIKREVLEEFGKAIHNVEHISNIPTLIDYDVDSNHEYAKLYKGIKLITFKADYLHDDKHLYGKAGDSYKVKLILIEDAITFFKKHAANMRQSKDRYNFTKANETIKTLTLLNKRS